MYNGSGCYNDLLCCNSPPVDINRHITIFIIAVVGLNSAVNMTQTATHANTVPVLMATSAVWKYRIVYSHLPLKYQSWQKAVPKLCQLAAPSVGRTIWRLLVYKSCVQVPPVMLSIHKVNVHPSWTRMVGLCFMSLTLYSWLDWRVGDDCYINRTYVIAI